MFHHCKCCTLCWFKDINQTWNSNIYIVAKVVLHLDSKRETIWGRNVQIIELSYLTLIPRHWSAIFSSSPIVYLILIQRVKTLTSNVIISVNVLPHWFVWPCIHRKSAGGNNLNSLKTNMCKFVIFWLNCRRLCLWICNQSIAWGHCFP